MSGELTAPLLGKTSVASRLRRVAPLAALVVLGAAGVAAVRWASRLGIGVGYDSMFYLTAAESLLHGQGLRWAAGGGEFKPLIHYPPLYPSLLAGVAGSGLNMVEAAAWTSALLFGLNIILPGLLTYWITRSLPAGLGVAAVVLFSPVMVEVHLEAMSEPLFLLFLVVALGMLAEHGQRGGVRSVVLAGVAAGLAYLTRYVGLTLIVGGLGAIALWSNLPVGRRFRDLIIFGGISLVPVLGWSARNLALTGSASNRVLNLHPISRTALRQAADTLSGWLLPESIDLRMRIAVLTMATGVGLFLFWKALRATREAQGARGDDGLALSCFRICLGFVSVYAAGLVTSLLFFDASTRFTDRILSPVHLVLLILAVVGVARLPKSWRWPASALVILLGVSYAWRSWVVLDHARVNGLAFNSRSWRSSDTIRWVAGLPAGTLIYSNEAFPIQFLTGHPAYWAPEQVDSVKGTIRPDYEEQVALMRTRLHQPGSVLVIFTGSHYRVELPPLEELTRGLVRIGATGDGLIFVDPVNLGAFERPSG
ncbi:MAG: phospholipid carrier-dependent glycosyltransferase [Chloroflexota bacterium]